MELAADTTLLVDLWRHRSRPERLADARQKSEGHTLLLPWMTKAEFLRGAFHQGVAEEQVELFLAVFPLIPFSPAALLRYARLWTEIAKTGQMVDYPDLWIGATALQHFEYPIERAEAAVVFLMLQHLALGLQIHD